MSMKTNIILLLLASALLSSCSHFYRITTSNTSASDYRILEAGDSSLRVIPWEYRNEMTPEVIREYSKVIPNDSVTLLTRINTTMSVTTSVFAGMLIGAGMGAAIGYATYTPTICNGSLICIDFGPGGAALGVAILFAIPSIIIGYYAASHDRDMLPINEHLDELRKEK